MSMFTKLPVLTLVAATLAGCASGLVPHNDNPNAVLAIAEDTGFDGDILLDGSAAIVYDPDGCQGWLIDDGSEGYSGRRFDPVSGLPVCNNLFPPGTVLGNYQNNDELTDFAPGNVSN